MSATAPVQTTPRQRIIDAAIACFARSGFHGASMQQICAEASMSPGALYRYFPSKVSIIAAIAEAERETHRGFIERLASADDPVEAMVGIGGERVDQILAGPGSSLCAEILAEAARNPEVRGMFDRNLTEARARITAALRRGQAHGQVDPELDTETAATLILAIGDGLSVHQGLNPALTPDRMRPVMQQMLRRFLRPAAVALALLLPIHAHAQDAIAKPPTVTTVAATVGSIAEHVTLTGTLVAREEVLVSPQIDGVAITEVLAEEGDRVERGQVLARLSGDVLEASLAQNTAQLSRAVAGIAQARASLDETQASQTQVDLALARTKDLLSSGNASREIFEQRTAAARMASARLDAAQNAVGLAEADRALAEAQRRELLVRLARTELRAPVAGVISRRTARLGAVVAGAGEPLYRIIENGAVELEADVPELQIAKLRPGQSAVLATVGGARTGRIRLVAPEVNPTTRLGRVRLAVDGAKQDDAGLVLGSFARATVETARHQGLLAPLSAILFQPDGPVVQVVANGTVETRPVQLGLRTPERAEVTAGLHQGDALVAVSGTFIRAGDRVTAIAANP